MTLNHLQKLIWVRTVQN